MSGIGLSQQSDLRDASHVWFVTIAGFPKPKTCKAKKVENLPSHSTSKFSRSQKSEGLDFRVLFRRLATLKHRLVELPVKFSTGACPGLKWLD